MRAVLDLVRWLFRLLTPTRPATRPGLAIEYAPVRDGDPDPGEVVWTWVPFEDDPRSGKDRPVLVIGRLDGRRVGLALTSKDSDRGDRIEVGAGAWDPSGAVSFAKLDRLIDLQGRPIRREGGALDRRRFDAIVAAFRARGTDPERLPRRPPRSAGAGPRRASR